MSNFKEIIKRSTTIGFGKAKLSVVNIVDDNTVYDEDFEPIDGFCTAIKMDLESPCVGTSSISVTEILGGDYQKIADMFALLAAEERGRQKAKS